MMSLKNIDEFLFISYQVLKIFWAEKYTLPFKILIILPSEFPRCPWPTESAATPATMQNGLQEEFPYTIKPMYYPTTVIHPEETLPNSESPEEVQDW